MRVDNAMKVSDWPEIEKMMKRQDFLCRNPPHCFFCGDEQVQLKRQNVPADWRCRICKKWFQYEPEAR